MTTTDIERTAPTTSEQIDASSVTAGAVTVLTWGFRISFAFIIAGLVLALVRDEPLAHTLGKPATVFDQLFEGHSNGVLGVGILAMILSPVVSALTIALGFLRIGDRRYALITGLVLLILVGSIALSLE
jgi:uncharacterized membrane protein